MITADEPKHGLIDAALASWRQGDCVLGTDHWFVHRAGAQVPYGSSGETSELRESEVSGFVVLTQSCDIVRSYKDRPYVSVAPLVQVGAEALMEIEKGYRPQFAAIPGVVAKNLVADLDRVMTVDKQVVAGWTRIQGCSNDDEVRSFSRAVGRKHDRFAFPTDFNTFAKKLQNRIKEKHDKQSAEGGALRKLGEIRVRAAPSWGASEVELMFWFVANPEDAIEVRKSGVLPSWLTLVEPSGRFNRVLGQITTHEELTALDYLESDRLDLDHLSDG